MSLTNEKIQYKVRFSIPVYVYPTLIPSGEMLTKEVDYKRNGQEILTKDGQYICDVGSKIARRYCEKINETTKN